MEKTHYVGKRIPRTEAYSKVTGQAVYGADVPAENAFFIKAVRSSVPHAKILTIDEAEALKIKGVITVLTSKDIPGENRSGKIKRDQPILADGKVRYNGEPIAAVVAETEAIAQEAAGKVKVDYELLRPVFSAEEALKPGASLVHDPSNLLREFNLLKGDIEEGFSHSDLVVENWYSTPFAEHAYIEPEAGFAKMDSAGKIWVYAPSQNSHHVSREIGQLLNLPLEKVRFVQTMMGGGFGGKIDVSVHGILALAAYKTKKPVKWIYTREESFLATTKRHPSMIHYRTGAKKNGKLMAADVDILLDSGAYASSGPAVATRAGIFAVGPYDVPHVRIRSRAVYTNHPIAGAMRGFGGPQVAFAHESQMDILAEKLGIDPYRLRKINCFKTGSETATGQVLKESVGMEKTLLVARKALGGRARLQKSISKPYEKRGIGYGCAFHGVGNTGVVNRSEVRMKLTEEGKVSIGVGASEIGQGLLTAFQQMAAEVLELSLDDIVIYNEDTFFTGDTEVTGGSKQTYMTGNAILQGARNFIKEVSIFLANHFKVSLESIVYSSGIFKVVRNGKVDKIRLSEVMPFILEEKKTPFEVKGDFTSQTIPLNPVSGQGDPYPTYSYSTQIAEVKVDTRTGRVHVVRIISATDVGKAINPETIEGQIVGGAVMGFGYGVMEEYLPNQTKNLREYLIPTACDAPRVLPIVVEDSVSSGPFGAKGIGEIVSVPTAAAIANAVTDAIGVRFFQVPITAERVSMALKEKKM